MLAVDGRWTLGFYEVHYLCVCAHLETVGDHTSILKLPVMP